MKLYFFPGACSLAANIALREAGVDFKLAKVDLDTGKADDGTDFRGTVNPKGYVPALQLDNGQSLTENVAVLQYIADLKPEKKLAPEAGTWERYRLMEWLSFINSEVHKNFSPLFAPDATDEVRQYARNHITKRLAYLEGTIRQEFLTGDQFTVADAYLFTVLGWAEAVNLDLQRWPALEKYLTAIGTRPQVAAAIASEA